MLLIAPSSHPSFIYYFVLASLFPHPLTAFHPLLFPSLSPFCPICVLVFASACAARVSQPIM